MQIYTKILIGMAVGTAIGLLVGPKSELLEPDLYLVSVSASGAPEVRLAPDDPSTQIEFPAMPAKANVQLRMEKLEVRTAEFTDEVGEKSTRPDWVKVEFEIPDRLRVLDKTGEFRSALEAAGATDRLIAWLHIKNKAVEGGGFVSTPLPISGIGDTIIAWLKPVGTIFMRLITMVIVPLVFASLLVGIASLGDVRKLGRMGLRTLGLYLATTAVAVTIGLGCAHLVNPGSFIAASDRAALTAQFEGDAGAKADAAAEAPSAIDNVVNIIPEKPLEALASGRMLQIIFFASILGIALTIMGSEESKLVVNFFDKVQQAMIIIIHMVMAIAPFGVAALIAEVVGTSGLSVLAALLVYGATVVLGLALHATLVYGGIVRTISKLPFIPFLKAIRPAQLIAFSTSSSSATLPVSMECAEENLGVSNAAASFVLPLGSTVNMDGTALYQGVAAIFIAQVFQIDLTLGAQLGIVLTATMASIGAAGVPGAGMVTLAMVLTAAGIPAVGVALILGMDRLLDMFRTAVNVTGDLAVTTAMAAVEGEQLRVLDPSADAADPDRGFEGRLDKEAEPVVPD